VHIFQIKRDQMLPLTLAEAWTFACDPRNMGAITPDWLCFDIRSEVPPCMYPGFIIESWIKALTGLREIIQNMVTVLSDNDQIVLFTRVLAWPH
jgi:hypothetical protein